MRVERPAYNGLANKWWSEVLYRTAVGAGAEPTRLFDFLYELQLNLIWPYRC
jgi:hypothetical protein